MARDFDDDRRECKREADLNGEKTKEEGNDLTTERMQKEMGRNNNDVREPWVCDKHAISNLGRLV